MEASRRVSHSVRQTIALIATLFVVIGGGLAYQTTMIDKRFELLENRLDYSEKNIIARFEDLKREVQSRDK